MTPRVEAVLAAFEAESFISSRQDRIDLELGGIPGDRHFGLTRVSGGRDARRYPRGTTILNRRQISVISAEETAEIAAALGVSEVRPEWLGANLVISGLRGLTGLPPGSRLVFPSGATLVSEGENDPCVKPGRVMAEALPGTPGLPASFVRAALRRRGIVAVVERGGVVRPGDGVEVRRSLERPGAELA